MIQKFNDVLNAFCLNGSLPNLKVLITTTHLSLDILQTRFCIPELKSQYLVIEIKKELSLSFSVFMILKGKLAF